MALDLTGIQNENEFYTSYYLREVLEKDLKDEFSDWAEQSGAGGSEEARRPPHEALGGQSGDYFQASNQLLDASGPGRRLQLQRELLTPLLETLGYEVSPMLKKLRDDRWLPVLGQVERPDGTPELCVVEAPPAEGEETTDLLERTLRAEQFEGLRPEHADPNAALSDVEVTENRPLDTELAEVITKGLFALDEPPRYVLVAGASQIVLLDRGKWPEKRLLRFELDEILGRKDTSTLKATVSLLHRQSTCPEEGFSLLDTFDENAHKHAFAVSEDLKYALREAIELIGNEAIWYIQNERKEKTYGELDADQLTTECLRYMYRLLFLFYIEARPELGYAPMDSDEYLNGYSLERLRDLELVDLSTEQAKSGHYLHHSIERLFSLIYNGYPAVETNGEAHRGDGQVAADFEEDGEAGPQHHTFCIEPLRSHLFDPERTPLLDGVKFRNETLQKVIRLMSLSDPDRRSSRERVSYAALGINQLGAVYEALLSYSGFFAEEDLYEVKEAGEDRDPLDVAYFVGEGELEDYAEDEIVFGEDGAPLVHEKGTFIYRLAGREREESASYYTPEVLTDCLVKYALKELIGEDSSDMPADDILDLTVCEPAMGSGAFLNEAVDQLAEAYLQRKQEETGEYISHEEYNREKQKVKMYLADNNVFGVDLNPVATELAEVSLWLNTIYEQTSDDPEHEEGGLAFVPWFGMQLTTGNSLIGARRQVYEPELLTDSGGRGKPPWMETPPERVEPGEERPEGHVYHFLLPDYEMASYSTSGGPGELAGEEIKDLRSWRRGLKSGYDREDLETLQRLSEAIDGLWEKHRRQQRRIREQTTDPIKVWGQPEPDSMRPPTTTRRKDEKWHTEMHSEGVRMSSPYRRLKLVMDYWCALWFWPIDEHDTVPTRQEWLMDLQMILEGDLYETQKVSEQQVLFESMEPDAKQLAMDLKDEHGFVNVDKLCERNPRLGLVQELADRYKFHHWELEYADLFERRGGFDLTIGNPPWVQVTWNDTGILSDVEPKIEVRDWSKPQVSRNRTEVIEENNLRDPYLADYEEAEGMQGFFGAVQNYPRLKGGKANTYKCFLPQAWRIGRDDGITSFLHPEGIYDDPNAGTFREALYPRLRGHYQFINEKRLFEEVHHTKKYSVNVYKNESKKQVNFKNIANLFLPKTIDKCFEHNGSGMVPKIKDENYDWSIEGHSERIVTVDDEALELFATLYDEEGTPPREARLFAVHSEQILQVLRRFAKQPRMLGDIEDEYFSTTHWPETKAQEDGTIERNTKFADNIEEWVLSGPHFFVATPLYKTPRQNCNKSSDYDPLDLKNLPADYLPRTNYVPACSRDEYRRRTPVVPWENEEGKRERVTELPRVMYRKMIDDSIMRTLIGALYPDQVSHIFGAYSIGFRQLRDTVLLSGLSASVPYDFFLKATGKSNFLDDTARQLPFPDTELRSKIEARTLLLNSLTTHYAELWEDSWQDAFTGDTWTKDDPRMNADTDFADLSGTWDWDTPLRTRYARRQALVELDVLAAQALGLTLDELQTIYRVQFPVLRKYEQNTWYDQNGRIIYTKNRGLTGVGFKSKKWKTVKDKPSGTVEQTVEDDTQPGGPTQRTIVYEAPFTKCDREADYERAWGVFEGRG
ncbi:Eco57I restriction-modification methylase domain-containing protein [Salinibacter ruber]|uniref:site-specific DNA-methyltransferase (adenine-specific) n=1 Tax=Salinibacter ruber TaxID=146919 RepID=A0A9X2UA01_9BACT|nr:hypothetical protein [Salinibacter ruber]MCS3952785.1 hypothetical protein [Salinibacter ruber]MCS3956434.1 hypothetical protein [Salinibacter ruber]